MGRAALSDERSELAGLKDDDRKRLFADGGRVSGHGGPTSDGIPILVSNGEFIVNQAAASKVGLANLESLNRGVLTRFASGGSPGGETSSTIKVDTESIANAVKTAISEAVSEVSLSINTTDASEQIA